MQIKRPLLVESLFSVLGDEFLVLSFIFYFLCSFHKRGKIHLVINVDLFGRFDSLDLLLFFEGVGEDMEEAGISLGSLFDGDNALGFGLNR